MELWEDLAKILPLVVALLGLLTALLVYKNHNLSLMRAQASKLVEDLQAKIAYIDNDQHTLSTRVNKLAKFAEGVSTTEVQHHDVILLGPRHVGKSTILATWFEQFRLNKPMHPTLEIDISEHPVGKAKYLKYRDEYLEVDRLKKIQGYLRIFDYGGEDALLTKALEQLSKTTNPTAVLFVLSAQEADVSENSRYYSASFLQRIRRCFRECKCSDVSFFVVFNKVDVASRKFNSGALVTGDGEDFIQQMRIANLAAMENIEIVLGQTIKCFPISATTNLNVINLLYEVGGSFFAGDGAEK